MIRFLLFIPLFFLHSCIKEETKKISFYHWKSIATLTEKTQNSLDGVNTEKIFIHFFDVTTIKKEQSSSTSNIYPVYVINKIDSGYTAYTLIPVIFITNNAIENANVLDLGHRITKLTDEISMYHFQKKLTQIQLDCDWTRKSKLKFFKLIEVLKDHFVVSVTIRLHQIKYMNENGIPPVQKGVLMLYNVGNLGDEEHNSILESDIVSKYISRQTKYPLNLDIALPLFSQTVLINNDKQVRLINGINRRDFESNTSYFRQINKDLFELTKDTLYKGFYLSQGCKIKLEQVKEDEIIASYQILKNSKLNLSGVVFYHLDDNILSQINLKQFIERL